MTTPQQPFTRRRTAPDSGMYIWLRTGERTQWYYLDQRPKAEVWAEHREELLREHVEHRPGTRPLLWWRYDAPEPRLRLGGVGSPLSDCCNQVAALMYGVPDQWRTEKDWDWLERGTAIDPSNPPMFESEASYLERLGLLLEGERERIKPKCFAPEVIRVSNDRVGLYRVPPDRVPTAS